ncbi:MAG: hypothetical protein AAFX50_02630 [Acidobacteriota bacterium]
MTRLTFAALALTGLFTLLAAAPADACREHEAGLPASASVDGALAEFLVATEGMNKKERRAYRQGLTEAQRQAIDSEVRALPAQERKALTKALRMNPNKLRNTAHPQGTAPAEAGAEPQS